MSGIEKTITNRSPDAKLLILITKLILITYKVPQKLAPRLAMTTHLASFSFQKLAKCYAHAIVLDQLHAKAFIVAVNIFMKFITRTMNQLAFHKLKSMSCSLSMTTPEKVTEELAKQQ
jgi:hypothetical protein